MNKNPTTKKQNPSQLQLVSGFEGYFSFLSNDFPAWVYFEGISYPSVSTAFQAARTDDEKIRQRIAQVTNTQQFRKIAISIPNPVDWAQRKEKVMTNLVRDKFKRNRDILEKFLATKQKKLINVMKSGGYNEQYWGVFEGKGKNILGKILMNIREEFTKQIDTKQWIENNLNLEQDIKMCANVSILVQKDGKKVERLNLDKNKNYYLFGSLKTSDFILQNPTISRNHACLYFSQLEVMLVDLKSTHGTFIKRKGQQQKLELDGLIGYRLYKDDVIQFGTSARQYIVNIDRTEIEKYIAEQQSNLKSNLKDIPDKYDNPDQYAKLSKQEIKNMLGIENQCLLVEELSDKDNYHKLKEYFNRFERVKDIRTKVNSKTGKSQGSAVIYFVNPNAVSSILKRKKDVQYKVRGIGKAEAEALVSRTDHGHRRRSKSKSRDRQRKRQKQNSRQRSRQKKERRYRKNQ